MYRYRVNYHLLVGLVVGGVFFLGAFYALWRFQVNRTAGWYQKEAENMYSADDIREAFRYQQMYVRIRPDEPDAKKRLTEFALEIMDLPDAQQEDLGTAFVILDTTVRETDDPELRRKLVDLQMRINRPQDAEKNLQDLLKLDPTNGELMALRAQALFMGRDFRAAVPYAMGLIGYDKKTEEFNTDKAPAVHEPDVYALLANYVRTRDKDFELANRFIDQMVAMNPDSHDAFVKQSVYLRQANDPEAAKAALERAFELAPEDANVLSLMGAEALREDNFEEATRLLKIGIEKYPENYLFYRQLAQVELAQNQYDQAIEYLEQGIQRFGVEAAHDLVRLKIEVLFAKEDIPAVEEEIERLERLRSPKFEPLIDFEKALILMQKSEWTQASRALSRVRPKLVFFPLEQAKAGILLGRCYERLGKFDLASRAYDRVLEDHPDMTAAVQGKSRVEAKLHPTGPSQGDPISTLVKQTMALPEEQQDWGAIDRRVDEFLEANGYSETQGELIKAQILMQRGIFDEAREILKRALAADPENLMIRLAAVRLLQYDPASGPEKALALLDQVTEKYGDNATMRGLRSDLLMAIRGEDLPEQLNALTENMDDFTPSDQTQVWSVVGTKFQQLGRLEDTRRCWEKALEIAPTNLPLLMQIFELSLLEKDDDAMQEAQARILKLVEDEKDANYVVTEIKRRIVAVQQGKLEKEALREANKMLQEAIARRPDWHELYILNGHLAYLLDGDIARALDNFDQALLLGPPNINAVRVQVQLLAQTRRFEEARERIEYIPENLRNRLLGRTYAAVLLEAGESDKAFEAAQQLLQENPDDADTQAWFALVSSRLERTEETEAALLRTTQIHPESPTNWTKLIQFYAQQKQLDKVDRALREASLALEAEYLSTLAAQHYEFLGQWREAEQIYLRIYEDRMDELFVARKLASFYLRWKDADPFNEAKAVPYLNTILRAVYSGEVPPSNPDAAWARQQVARQLASEGRYDKNLLARKLIKGAAVDGELSPADRALLGEILSSRLDPVSQVEAERVLSEMDKRGELDLGHKVLLARTRSRLSEWQDADKLLLDLIDEHPEDPGVWRSAVLMLIENKEFARADRGIDQLERLGQSSSTTEPLKARLASAEGNKKRLRTALQKLLPQISGAVTDAQLDTYLAVASLAAELKDTELAEQLYTFVAGRRPEVRIRLAGLLATQGDADKAMQLLASLFRENPDEVLQTVVGMLRERRDEIGDRFDKQADAMFDAALRDDPDSAQRLLLRAEAYDAQERYADSVETYERVLSRYDVPDRQVALAKNNLAFLLGLRGERLDDAETMINDAIDYFGPLSEALDSRAVVNIAREDYASAINDMRLAVKINPTPLKYFHLAQALILSGDAPAALEAWDTAVKMGLEPTTLPKLERGKYQETADLIAGARSQNAGL